MLNVNAFFSTEFIVDFESEKKIIIYTWGKMGLYWNSMIIEPAYI